MTTDFFEDRRRREREAREHDAAAYPQLIRKAALDAPLSKADRAELDRLIDVLGKGTEAAEADAAVVREERAAVQAGGGVADDEAELTAAAKAHNEIIDAKAEACRRFDEQIIVAARQCDGIRARIAPKREALKEAEQLRKAHWQLFDGEDPAIVKRRRHLLQTIGGLPDGLRYEVSSFESAMAAAEVGQALDPDNARIEYVLAPGQSREQLDAMRQFIRDLRRNMQKALYLMTAADAEKFENQSCIIIVDGRGKFAQNQTRPPSFPFPGQTAEQLAELGEQLDERLKKEKKLARENAIDYAR